MKALGFINTEEGIEVLLLSIVVLMAFYICLRLIEFFWKQYTSKSEKTDEAIKKLTRAVEENTKSLKSLDGHISEFPKLKTDLNRLYTATKMLAGDQWPQIREEIMQDAEMKGI